MILESLVGIIWFINCVIVFILAIVFIIVFVGDGYYKVKCPYCRNKQRDSTYRKQVCDRCNKEWFDAYDD